MRSTDERIDDVFGRAREHEATQRRRRRRAVSVGGGILSVIVVVLVGLGVSSVSEGPLGSSDLAGQLGLMGSVLANGAALGYVVVGLLGIVLGAAVTMAAYRFGHPTSKGTGSDDGERAP